MPSLSSAPFEEHRLRRNAGNHQVTGRRNEDCIRGTSKVVLGISALRWDSTQQACLPA